ncbi:MAG TPA: hypothetical protein VKA83_09425 [Methylomirabilota bacterium]|nr:hypothetical protein [Methylomirabilota bacterium]
MAEKTLADVRGSIKSAMEEITGIGVVTDFEPYFRTEAEIKQFFQATEDTALLGWTITRERSEETDVTIGEINEREHLMVIRGYAALNLKAASEKAFQDLVETVCDRLRQEQIGDFDNEIATGKPNVRTVEARFLGNDLCHYAEITLPCTVRVAVP